MLDKSEMLPASTPFGVDDCDECGAMDVPIVAMNEEGFAWCADCVPSSRTQVSSVPLERTCPCCDGQGCEECEWRGCVPVKEGR